MVRDHIVVATQRLIADSQRSADTIVRKIDGAIVAQFYQMRCAGETRLAHCRQDLIQGDSPRMEDLLGTAAALANSHNAWCNGQGVPACPLSDKRSGATIDATL